jgi:hypothetical protein
MSDNDDPNKDQEAETQESLDAFKQKIERGEPILSFVFEPPFDINIDPSGAMILDVPAMQHGDKAAVVRVRFTPEAVNGLREALKHVPQGETPPKRSSPH